MSLESLYYYFKPELAPIPADQAENIAEPKNIILPKGEDHDSKYAKGLEILQRKIVRQEILTDEDNDFAPVIHEYKLSKNQERYTLTDKNQTTHEFSTINQAIIYLSKQYKNDDFFAINVQGDEQNNGNYIVNIKSEAAFTEKFTDEVSFFEKIRKSIDTRIHGVDWDFQLENQTTGKTDYITEDPNNGQLKRYESEAAFLESQDRHFDIELQTETIRLIEVVYDKDKGKWNLCDLVTGTGSIFDTREKLDEYLQGDFLTSVKNDEKFPTKVVEILDHTIEDENMRTSWVVVETGQTIKDNPELLKTLSETKEAGRNKIKEWGIRYLHQNRVVPIATRKNGTSQVFVDIFERDKALEGLSKAGTFFLVLWAATTGVNAYRTLTEGPAMLSAMAKKEAAKIKAKENAQEAFKKGKETLKKFADGDERDANQRFAKNVNLEAKTGPPVEGEETQTAVYINLFGLKDLTEGGRAKAHVDNLGKINKHYDASYYKDFSTSQDPVGDITAFLSALQATGHDIGLVFLSGHGNAFHMSGLPLTDQADYSVWADHIAKDASVILGGCETGAEIAPVPLQPGQEYMNYNPRWEMNATQQLSETLASRGHIGNVYGNKEASVTNTWEPTVNENGNIEWKSLEFLQWRADLRGRDIAFVQSSTAYPGPAPAPAPAPTSADLNPPPFAPFIVPSLQDFNVVVPEKPISEEPISEHAKPGPTQTSWKKVSSTRIPPPPEAPVLQNKRKTTLRSDKPTVERLEQPSEPEQIQTSSNKVSKTNVASPSKSSILERVGKTLGFQKLFTQKSEQKKPISSKTTLETQSKPQQVQNKPRKSGWRFFRMIKKITVKAWNSISSVFNPSSSDLKTKKVKKK